MSIEVRLEIVHDSHNTRPNQDDLKFRISDTQVYIVTSEGGKRELAVKKEDFVSLLKFCKLDE